MKYRMIFVATIVSCLFACSVNRTNNAGAAYIYKIDDQALYDTIVKLDSIFFDAYNNCLTKMDLYSSFYSDSLEFYHDKSGLTTSKQEVLDGTRKFICGKVTRQVISGSIEVYPLPGFGAVEMGLHRFHNSQEPLAVANPGRFTIFWRKTPGGWKITKVISLH